MASEAARADAAAAPLHVDVSDLRGRFYIPADEAKALLVKRGVDSTAALHAYLLSLVKPASALARPPISGFTVGCVEGG
jgi:cytidine deaminase